MKMNKIIDSWGWKAPVPVEVENNLPMVEDEIDEVEAEPNVAQGLADAMANVINEQVEEQVGNLENQLENLHRQGWADVRNALNTIWNRLGLINPENFVEGTMMRGNNGNIYRAGSEGIEGGRLSHWVLVNPEPENYIESNVFIEEINARNGWPMPRQIRDRLRWNGRTYEAVDGMDGMIGLGWQLIEPAPEVGGNDIVNNEAAPVDEQMIRGWGNYTHTPTFGSYIPTPQVDPAEENGSILKINVDNLATALTNMYFVRTHPEEDLDRIKEENTDAYMEEYDKFYDLIYSFKYERDKEANSKTVL